MEIKYNLYDLPSTQHKAGLIGLLLTIRAMQEEKLEDIPEVEWDDFSATIRLTEITLQALMQYIYRGTMLTSNEGKPHCRPALDHFAILGWKPIWINLWRWLISSCIITAPLAQKMYEKEYKANQLWKDLTNNPQRPVPGTLIIGGEASSGEGVDVKSEARLTFLLYFTLVASLPFVPYGFDREGKIKSGYCLSIPEPTNIDNAYHAMLELIPRMSEEPFGRGSNPKEAMIVLPQEGGLKHLCNIVPDKTEKKLNTTLHGVEVYTWFRETKKERFHVASVSRIYPDEQMLEGYRDASRFNDFLFRKQLIQNVVSRKPWYWAMDVLLRSHSLTSFMNTGFGNDVGKKLKEDKMENSKSLVQIADKITARFVFSKTERRTGVTYERAKISPNEGEGKRFFDEMRKVCSRTQIRLRSLGGPNFINYFCNVIVGNTRISLHNDDIENLVTAIHGKELSVVRITIMLKLCQLSNYFSTKE
jgi:CRISPR-associated protein Cmx8